MSLISAVRFEPYTLCTYSGLFSVCFLFSVKLTQLWVNFTTLTLLCKVLSIGVNSGVKVCVRECINPHSDVYTYTHTDNIDAMGVFLRSGFRTIEPS